MTARTLLPVLGLLLAGFLFTPQALAQEQEGAATATSETADDVGPADEVSQAVAKVAQATGVEVSTEANLPDPTGTGMREAVTPIANEIHAFYEFILLPMKLLISFFVLGLIIWVLVRYNKVANPIPRRFSHNTLVEVAWTLVPVLILLIIALPSFDLLYLEDTMPDGQKVVAEPGQRTVTVANDFPDSRLIETNRHIEVAAVNVESGERRLLETDEYEVEGFGEPELTVTLAGALPQTERLEVIGGRSRVGRKPILGLFGADESQIVPAPSMTIKATGYQWGWNYSYPDFGEFEFDALIAPPDAVPSELYRFAATNDVVVPAGETVRVITTGRDVIHSWAMPSFGVKIDAIPGRLNETWFYTEELGTYYGQCSEICGKDHAFMPIAVRVVSRPEFEAWVDEQRDFNGLEPLFQNQDQLAAAAPATTDLN
ncbi:cytochrome c oxidase subunit 2 [Parvularcula dongshanensis]|uniref:Cytochrome c oxidase subunit 2 n=1 Tax=Parvularcula dongshanensis TaxID=1173995 RepID=A0A840I0E2_9PROT|nr:cytochrome c oxidase subunit II [Parvularcula dongshanensis]MBB4658536.1 cytochrome c oxidase subunit 2 [Parvularcula dongshanensis]